MLPTRRVAKLVDAPNRVEIDMECLSETIAAGHEPRIAPDESARKPSGAQAAIGGARGALRGMMVCGKYRRARPFDFVIGPSGGGALYQQWYRGCKMGRRTEGADIMRFLRRIWLAVDGYDRFDWSVHRAHYDRDAACQGWAQHPAGRQQHAKHHRRQSEMHRDRLHRPHERRPAKRPGFYGSISGKYHWNYDSYQDCNDSSYLAHNAFSGEV